MWIAYDPIVCWEHETLFAFEAFVRTGEPGVGRAEELQTLAELLERRHDLGRAIRARVARDSLHSPAGTLLFVPLLCLDELWDFDLLSPAAPLYNISHRVVLEIPAHELAADEPSTRARLSRLGDLGFRVALKYGALDPKGLIPLLELKPAIIKFQPPLTQGLDRSRSQRDAMRILLRLAKEAKTRTVCESVAGAAERDTLQWLGAHLFQGPVVGLPSREFAYSRRYQVESCDERPGP